MHPVGPRVSPNPRGGRVSPQKIGTMGSHCQGFFGSCEGRSKGEETV